MDVSVTISQGSLTMTGPASGISMTANKGDITMNVVSYTSGGGGPVHGDSLLLENGSYFLLESGDTLLLG